jgi:apolipoprotein N-acyltransferase
MIMKKIFNVNTLAAKFILLFIAGIINFFIFAPFNFTILCYVSFLIVLFILKRTQASAKQIFLLGFTFGLAFYGSLLYWLFICLNDVIKTGEVIAVAGYILMTIAFACFPALVFLLYSKLKTKYDLFNLLLLMPSLWVLAEWARQWVFTGFPWYDVGNIQVNSHIFRGMFAIIGVYGISWFTLSIIGALYLIITTFKYNKLQYRITIIYLCCLTLTLYLTSNINFTSVWGQKQTVALIQGNIGANSKWDTNEAINVYLNQIKQVTADIVITPETGISIFEQNLPPGYLENLKAIAISKHENLIIGLPIIIDNQNNYVNAAMVLTAPGRPYYAKSHLVPYGEYIPLKDIFATIYRYINLPMVGFVPGKMNQMPLVVGMQKIAFNICFENAFGSELITSARQSTVMVNLSDMIWYGKSYAMDQHLQISQARALENQRDFIQETNTGITAIINKFGEIEAIAPTFHRTVVEGTIQGYIGETIYQKFGNLIVLALIAIIILSGFLLRKYK